MSSCHFSTLVLILAFFSPTFTGARGCTEAFFKEAMKRNITHCKKLNTLGAEFGWNYHNESLQIDILFGAKIDAEAGWLAWGVNPSRPPQMAGTRALIAIRQPNGSSVINTYNITRETKLGCSLNPSEIEVEVHKMKFDFNVDGTEYWMIQATLGLPSGYDISRLNHVWQVGYLADGTEPKKHPMTLHNVDSTETIDLKSGNYSRSIGKHRHHLRKVHGILNIMGWGTLLPMGVIIARYFRNFPFHKEWWFGLHITLQIVGYINGTTGWFIGLWLGQASKYYTFATHRLLAIFIFTFTTLQMLALRLRPGRTDEYRKYWNMYHHFLGYALLALIAANIFQGISILKPDNSWKRAYIILLSVLLSITVVFEIITWGKFIYLKIKKKRQSDAQQNAPKAPTT